MNLDFWQTCSTYAGWAILFLGICTAVSLFVRATADNKIKRLYRKQISNKLDSVVSDMSQIRSRLPHTPRRLFESVAEGTKAEAKLRLASFDKYNNEDYYNALTDINQAITIVDDNPQNFLVRGLINTALYSEMHPMNYDGGYKPIARYADNLYDQAENDYKKAIELNNNESDAITIETIVQLQVLKWHKKCIWGGIDMKKAKNIREEIRKESAALLTQFPDNEKVKRHCAWLKKYDKDLEKNEELLESFKVKNLESE